MCVYKYVCILENWIEIDEYTYVCVYVCTHIYYTHIHKHTYICKYTKYFKVYIIYYLRIMTFSGGSCNI